MEYPADPTDSISDCLKCPICMEVPKNKVFQCKDGHTVCEECHSQLTICPQCRIPFGDEPIRTLAIEKMLEELRLESAEQSSAPTYNAHRNDSGDYLYCCSNLAKSLPASVHPKEGELTKSRRELGEEINRINERLRSNSVFTFKSMNDRDKFVRKVETAAGLLNSSSSTLEQIQLQIRSLRIWASVLNERQ